MDTVIDSKKKQLSFQEVMMYRVYAEAEKGALENPPENVLMLLVEELKMPNCEAILFGNTFFVAHINAERTGVVARMINVDTTKNMKANVLQYIRKLQSDRVQHVMFFHQDNALNKYLDSLRKEAVIDVVSKPVEDDTFVSCITVQKMG